MPPTSRARPGGPALTGQDWWGAFELVWPRPTYDILESPQGAWGQAWAAIPHRRIPFLASPLPTPWVPIGREAPLRTSLFGSLPRVAGPSAGETSITYRLGWPAGGIFGPNASARVPDYAPLPVAAEILLDAQGVAPDDPAKLLAFVNRWGRLGVGLPGAEDFGADGVQWTGACLRELTQWIQALYALQHRQPTTITWAELATVLETRLAGVHLGASPVQHGLVPRFPLGRLLDALYLELWGWATAAKRLRRCPRCTDFFIRRREDQIFCTGRCARLWHVKRWKNKQRQQQRRQRRTREDC